jgi:hypothetical protein
MNDTTILPGHSTSRDEIYKGRERALMEELRRGVEAEDGRDEPEQGERRLRASARTAEAPVPTVNIGGPLYRVDDSRVVDYAQTAHLLPQTWHELQGMIQQQNARNMDMLQRDYGDVFQSNTAARLAGIHVQDIRQADMARGIVRGDGEVFREAAEATRKVMRGRKAR